MMLKNKIAMSVLSAIVLAGCGAESTVNVKEAPDPALTGVFVDSPVSGLGYRSESVPSGVTNADGQFNYFRGEVITFHIGEFEFPAVAASSIITPLRVFGADTPFQQSVANTLRLLQALDVDGDPSNGIEISPSAASAASMLLAQDQTVEQFFNRPASEFAADVEPWLAAAGGAMTTLAPFDSSLAHFVNYLESEFGTLIGSTFDINQFNGTLYNPFLSGKTTNLETITFTPGEDATKGTFVISEGESATTGSYEFTFGRRAIKLSTETETTFIIAKSFNTVDQVYSLCTVNGVDGVATAVASCDAKEDKKNNLLALSQEQADAELIKLEEQANSIAAALDEDFNVTTNDFFSSGYKTLLDYDPSVGMYAKTGGSTTLDETNGHLVLAATRFSIGNVTPSASTTPNDTAGSGIFNLSEGFTISFDVIAHTASGKLSMYVDNNTASQVNSVQGAASKIYDMDINETNTPVGQRFTYTYVPGSDVTGLEPSDPAARILNPAIKNSFFQLRTDSNGNITIDNLKIETVADSVPIEEPEEPEGPPAPPKNIPVLTLPFNGSFAGVTDDIFSSAYAAVKDADDLDVALYTKTGGSVTVLDSGLELDGGRFTIGNAVPGNTSSSADLQSTGVFDLSRPYNIVMDVVAVDFTDATKKLQVYIDNNTSGSSNSVHGGASRIYNEEAGNVTVGTLTIPGTVGTKNSFIQIRTEGGAKVVVDNIRIEYFSTGFSCASEPDLYFCDDFTQGVTSNYDLLAQDTNTEGAIGFFDTYVDQGNTVLRYNAGGAGGELMLFTEAAMANVPENANYFVEAKIRPRQNSTTANKQLYLLGRYDSAGNWYGGGLNVQNAPSSTQVEVAVSVNGSISRPVQTKSPIYLGEKNGEGDGIWYSVRFEMIDTELSVYLDGELMGSASDSTFSTKGLSGIFTNNRSFELDDLKIGDPRVKPIQLTLDYKEQAWDTSTTSDPLVINITAMKNDGLTVDTFTVASSSSDVVKAELVGNELTLTPLSAGTSDITVVSGSDPSIVRTIRVSVAAGFVMPTESYGDLSGKVSPAIAATSQYIDGTLSLTFDSVPTLGSIGEVRIFDASNDALVDTINVGSEIDSLGYQGQDRVRRLNTELMWVDGNQLIIKPHNSMLDYNTTYYVVIGNGVVSGTQLNGVDFVGLGENSNWYFTTKTSAPSAASVTVDDDGTADFRTVQAALNYAMQHLTADTPATIMVKDGTYNEPLYLRNKNNLTISGESRDNTLIQFVNYDTKNTGSGGSEAPGTGAPNGGRSVFLVEGADLLTLTKLTLKNAHIRSSAFSNQAETIYFNSNNRLIAKEANFISEQDTLLLKGYSWFFDTLVAGNVDFIWGYPVTALFEESEIRTIGDSKNGDPNTDTSGGYILQARVPVESDPGFVFLNSEFTHGPGPIGNDVLDNSTYIARSGGNSSYFDNVTLINNKFDTHIASSGWAVLGVNSQPAPNPATATATSGWREYGSMDMAGNLLDLSARVGGYVLSAGDVANLSDRVSIFASYNSNQGWDPAADNAAVVGQILADKGFAGHNFDVTGGAGGTVITVDNGVALINALSEAKNTNVPVTIFVDGTITDANSGGSGNSIDIKDMDNVSIIGVADRGEFDGIGIQIRRANNIIIQNLKIHHVLTGGKDAISIEGDTDGSTTENIWIDHNELYSTMSVDKDYYDGLIDTKSGAKNITISYNYLHDHWKASLHGHTEPDTASSNTERNITFHHNRFENIESRLPLFRYGYGHLYNNYFNNIHSTAINSRRGAELLIENNVFENTQNPIVSFYTDVVGYWNLSGNILGDGVTWTTPDSGEISAQDGQSTSSYVVPYDYELEQADVVKINVINLSGVGKLDQSNLDIPAIDNSGQTPVDTDVSLPYSENFSAPDVATFFSADYKNIPGDSSAALYKATGGGSNIKLIDGQLHLISARFTLGNSAPSSTTSSNDTPSTSSGVFDLSKPYKVVMDIISVGGSDTTKDFQVYVDNNTASSGESMHGSASKFYGVDVSTLTVGTLEIPGLVANANSFLQFRTETGASVVIDNLRIEYLPAADLLNEDFSATDATRFLSADYKSLAGDGVSAMYYVTGGGDGLSIVNEQLSLASARFTVGNTTPGVSTTENDTTGTGVFDLSKPYKVVMDIISVGGTDTSKDFQIYVNNNTSSSSQSQHGGASKFFAVDANTLTIGTLEVAGLVANANSFLQIRTETGATVVLDNLRIQYTD
ncbi:pectinesterase family protein [Flavobacterium sp. W21_SRS_FM6]|uniref:pectinesterase family protein n=1 Tax=Flavobacterium sp. W21_SRS_FM6 TaxID=3240268 RepID=UPI003F93E799